MEELPERGQLWRGRIKNDLADNGRRGLVRQHWQQEGRGDNRWGGKLERAVFGFVKTGFDRRAAIGLAIVVLVRGRPLVLATDKKAKAGKLFQPAMISGWQP
jgi:hypothetical protein